MNYSTIEKKYSYLQLIETIILMPEYSFPGVIYVCMYI